MKKILILFTSILFSILAFSQQKQYLYQDTVHVEGYYIIKYKKGEILRKQQNLGLKEKGKSFEIIIDYETTPYFFSTRINKKNVSNENNIADIISTDDYKNIEIYKFPPYNQLKIDSIVRSYNILPDKKMLFNKKDKEIYFKNTNNDNYLYRICHMQGYAFRLPVNMDWDINLANEWDIIPTVIDKRIPAFYIYNFYKYDSINWNPSLLGFIEYEM